MESMPSEAVLVRVDVTLSSGHAISYEKDIADKAYPEVRWAIFGLVETNEIAVVAECGATRIGICAKSTLLAPAMADRIFGIDATDSTLAKDLSKALWDRYGPRCWLRQRTRYVSSRSSRSTQPLESGRGPST